MQTWLWHDLSVHFHYYLTCTWNVETLFVVWWLDSWPFICFTFVIKIDYQTSFRNIKFTVPTPAFACICHTFSESSVHYTIRLAFSPNKYSKLNNHTIWYFLRSILLPAYIFGTKLKSTKGSNKVHCISKTRLIVYQDPPMQRYE